MKPGPRVTGGGPGTATCSSAGARWDTSPNSARPGSCCSTPSSRPAWGPTGCPGTPPA